MNVEVETPVEVTDPDVIETPVETVAEAVDPAPDPENITAPEPTAEAANYSAGPEDGVDDPNEPLTEEDQDEEIDE